METDEIVVLISLVSFFVISLVASISKFRHDKRVKAINTIDVYLLKQKVQKDIFILYPGVEEIVFDERAQSDGETFADGENFIIRGKVKVSIGYTEFYAHYRRDEFGSFQKVDLKFKDPIR